MIMLTLIVIAVLLVLFLIGGGIFTVDQQTVAIIERLGKFNRAALAGLNIKIPFIENKSDAIDLRVQQLDVEAETKTGDNVFVKIKVSVQYFILPEKVFEAHYKLENPQKQISSYVFDVIRAKVPKLKLDEVFEKKEDIALAVKQELAIVMDDFGYNILQTLVTDIDPDAKVKASMNEINAAQRNRVASIEKGESEKILVVKNAEAQAESKRLQGVGIAQERLAIVEGLEKSIADLKTAGIKGDEVMQILMLTQYFDTLQNIGKDGAKVILLPHSPAGLKDIEAQIRNAIISGKEV